MAKSEIHIKNCDVLGFKNGKAEGIANQDILVNDNVIAVIGTAGSLQVSPDAKIITAAGLLAVPGNCIAYRSSSNKKENN